MEGVFGDGRTAPFRRPCPGRRHDDRGLPGVRHLPQDRLQAAGALPRGRAGADRPVAADGAIALLVGRSGAYGGIESYANGLLVLREDFRDPVLRARGAA